MAPPREEALGGLCIRGKAEMRPRAAPAPQSPFPARPVCGQQGPAQGWWPDAFRRVPSLWRLLRCEAMRCEETGREGQAQLCPAGPGPSAHRRRNRPAAPRRRRPQMRRSPESVAESPCLAAAGLPGAGPRQARGGSRPPAATGQAQPLRTCPLRPHPALGPRLVLRPGRGRAGGASRAPVCVQSARAV